MQAAIDQSPHLRFRAGMDDKSCYVATGLSLAAILLVLHRLVVRAGGKGNAAARRLPPSPPAVPFLGHLHLLASECPLHSSLARLAARHGPVLSLRLGSRAAVVVSSPECAEACFTEHDVAFANRPRLTSQALASFGGAALAVSSYGPYWRNLRRVAAVRLLSTHRVACMCPVISAEVRAMLRRVGRAAEAAGRVQLKASLFELSLSVLMETIAQTKTSRADDADDAVSPEAHEFRRIVDEILPYLGATNLWDYLPLLRRFDVLGVRNKIRDVVGRRDAFLQRLIDAERRRLDGDGDGDEKKSMIAVMLSLQKSEPDVYTDTMIMALCGNLFTAGTETTSSTIEWAMSLLLNHPEALKKAEAEIEAAVGASRLITMDDVPGLGYLQCVINETLRLYPVAPLLLPHESAADCTVGGYDVPRGTLLFVNAYAIHRDPAAWEEPDEFRPERFRDGKAEGRLMLPFGMGRRRCPGETLALRTAGLVLATLIQCFHWDRIDGAEIDMTESGGLTMPRAVPLEATCKPREAMRHVLQQL
uniref:Cytochrome P450 n=1 Tax=Zea mays TaxID=4577 RepID=A0A804NQU9_MAIZE